MGTNVVDLETVSHTTGSMGGVLEIAITVEAARRAEAEAAARRAAARVNSWAARLTRFSPESDLMTLNASTDAETTVRPTLAAALCWAQDAERRSHGVVDATMLDQRLAAELGGDSKPAAGARSWRMSTRKRSAVVKRDTHFSFDLDGVAKGWIADRAADLLHGWPGVAVNADGDIAFHVDSGVEWLVELTDPRDDRDLPIATLRLAGGDGWTRSFGVATSGTTNHRWQMADGRITHHLIDRRTGMPAETDVVQATVVAPSAREAEMIAKSAVILGAQRAHPFLAHSSAMAAVLLLEDGEVIAMPGTQDWLA